MRISVWSSDVCSSDLLTRFTNGASFPFNGGRAKLYGADIELQARITPEFSINGNLGLVHSRMGDFPNAPNTIRLPNGQIVLGPDKYNAQGNDLPNAPKDRKRDG